MKTFLPKKLLYGTTILVLLASLFFACQKEISGENGGTTDKPADLTTKVTASSVSGFVTDENNAAVKNAAVKIGTASTTTNKFGYFEVKNVEVIKNAAFVTVTYPGYFKGIKTFIGTGGKGAFFRIKLIPKTNVGNINAASGGDVTLSNGMKVILPAAGVVNAATNAAYTGTVNVAAFWINPEAADLDEIMPGDLRGINTAGALKLLKTYGMAAVELTGAAGELLQIAPGKKSTLSLPIPASLAASAPANIPLWYFDETKGFWKEEGSAVKTGSSYKAEVSHFSFWNYDLPNNYVILDVTFKNNWGNGYSYVDVKITNTADGTFKYGRTDFSGFVSGAVPGNATLLLEIVSPMSCPGGPIYSQTIATANTNISLGVITVPYPSVAPFSGTVVDCSNQPVTNGRVYIMWPGTGDFIPYTVTNGSFSGFTCTCTPVTMDVAAEDLSSMQVSNPAPYTVTPGVPNPLGAIMACGNSNVQFMNCSINSQSYNLTYPVDWVYHFLQPQNNPPAAEVHSWGSSSPTLNTSLVYDQANIALNSIQNLQSFRSDKIWPDTLLTIASPIGVHITEYGSVGQFISGNFSGTLTGAAPNNTLYNITCSFRVKRIF